MKTTRNNRIHAVLNPPASNTMATPPRISVVADRETLPLNPPRTTLTLPPGIQPRKRKLSRG